MVNKCYVLFTIYIGNQLDDGNASGNIIHLPQTLACYFDCSISVLQEFT